MTDRDVLGCSLVGDGPPAAPASTQERCADCGALVWVAPSSRELIAEHDLEILCMSCLTRGAASDPEGAIVMPPSDRQIAEIIAAEIGKRRRN